MSEPVRVQIVGIDDNATLRTTDKPCTIKTSCYQKLMSGTTGQVQTQLLLPHAPNRVHASITVVGQSVDVVYICGSSGDAQNLSGAPVMGLMVIEMFGGDEIWVAATANTNVAIGVIAEYKN